MAKKKKETANSKNVSFSEAIGVSSFIHNEKTNVTVGLILFGISIFMLWSFCSFFSTGQNDQSIITNPLPGDMRNEDMAIQNSCGSIGAYISYFFIKCCFGFPAFLIPAFIFLVGLRLVGAFKLNLWKWFFGSMILLIWSSITCAKFINPLLNGQIFNAGGGHGEFICKYLECIIGTPGLTAILALTAIIFLTFVSTETINFIRKVLNPVDYISNRVKFKINNNKEEEEATDTVLANPYTLQETEEEEKTEEYVPDENASQPIDLTDEEDIAPAEQSESVAPEQKQPANNEPTFSVNQSITEDKAKGKTLTAEEVLSTPINPREPYTKYKFPTLDLLKKYEEQKDLTTKEELIANKKQIITVLNSFGVQIREITATIGPTITLYEITPAEGVRISKIRNLEDDIALSLKAEGIRIIAPIPGKGTIGIEVPNAHASIVSMESILNSRKFQDTKMELPLALGKTITNEVFMVDLAKIPHLLVAGATGQGKSVGLNAMIGSLLFKKHPNELKIVLVDPKKVEFSVYNPIANAFMAQVPDTDEEPIITDVTKVVRTLKGLCTLMDHRYDLLKLAGARNIREYNEKFINHRLRMTDENGNPLHDYMPYIVVIIDEFGDLIMTAGKEVELPIARIAQLARAVGIHMIIATQRPTTNIITGTIKANFPGRVAFRVGQMIDSRTILDRPGANQLIGKGDMLYLNGNEPTRVQCAFLDTPEVEAIAKHIQEQEKAGLTPQHPMELPEPMDDGSDGGSTGSTDVSSWDPLFEQAARTIVNTQQGSTSMIQRQYSIGYNRAGRLMDQLEKAGIVGPAHGSKPREVLIMDEMALENRIASLRGGTR